MTAALIIAFLASILLLWWLAYTISVFGRVAFALSLAIAAFAVMM